MRVEIFSDGTCRPKICYSNIIPLQTFVSIEKVVSFGYLEQECKHMVGMVSSVKSSSNLQQWPSGNPECLFASTLRRCYLIPEDCYTARVYAYQNFLWWIRIFEWLWLSKMYSTRNTLNQNLSEQKRLIMVFTSSCMDIQESQNNDGIKGWSKNIWVTKCNIPRYPEKSGK